MNPTQKLRLYPADKAHHTAEGLITRLNGTGMFIYTLLLCLFCIGLPILMMIKVDVVVRAAGVLRPQTPNHLITSICTGKIQSIYIREYQYVQKGDTLLRIADPGLAETLNASIARRKELRLWLEDLNGLQGLRVEDSVAPFMMKTPLYDRAYRAYQIKHRELYDRHSEQDRQWLRHKQLFLEQVIAAVEYDAAEHAMNQSKIQLAGYHHAQIQLWRNEQSGFEKELRELEAYITDLQAKQEQLSITAPVAGNIVRIAGLARGSMIYAGQELLEISPDTLLLAECYLSPAQIGFIHTGQPVKIAADAFPHTQWGMQQGEVSHISPDVYVAAGQKAYFKILCSLNSCSLSSTKGRSVLLKKGMGVQVRIILCKRRIFHLFYERFDQWVNPNHIAAS